MSGVPKTQADPAEIAKWIRGSIFAPSVKRHIIGTSKKKCPNFPTDGRTKVKEFYAKKKRISIADVVE